jgi:hypothetical protein
LSFNEKLELNEKRQHGEYTNIYDNEIDFISDFSRFINFKVGSLFSIDESQQQMEETTCPGMH